MASILGFGKQIPQEDYLIAIKDFDVKVFEAEILLQLPLEILLDDKKVRKIVRREINRELQELVARVLISKKGK